MILPTNCFQSWDLIFFRHQFRRYVEHLFECEICRFHNGVTTVLVILFHECCWFHCYSHKHSPDHRMFSPFSVTLEILFCLFRTWSFTRFTNDLDSTDSSNSASSFPMSNCWGPCLFLENRYQVAPICHEVFLRSLRIARFRREEFPRDQVELFVSFSKKFYQVALVDRTS